MVLGVLTRSTQELLKIYFLQKFKSLGKATRVEIMTYTCISDSEWLDPEDELAMI